MVAYIRKRGVNGYVDCSGLFSKRHTIDNWHRKIGREVQAEARAGAPVRTGRLKSSIHLSGPHKYGTHGSEMKIRARAPYAFFVHDGTSSPIVSRSGKKMGPMSMPAGGSGYKTWTGDVYKRKKPITKKGLTSHYGISKKYTKFVGFPLYQWAVSGQDSNPFLAQAMAEVGGRHRWRPGRGRMQGWEIEF